MMMTMSRWEVTVVPRTVKDGAAGRGDAAKIGSPDGQGAVFHDEDQSDGHDEGTDMRLVIKGPVDEAFDDHADKKEGGNGNYQGDPVGNSESGDAEKGDIGPDHVKGPVGEIGDFQDAENQRQSQGDHGIDRAQHDAVDDRLQQ